MNANDDIASIVREGLTNAGYKFEEFAERYVFRLLFTGQNVEMTVTVFCGIGYLTIQVALPFIVPTASVVKLLEMMNEQNRQMPVGGFEYHESVSKVIYKLGLHIPPMPTSAEVAEVLQQAVAAADLSAKEVFRAIADE